MKNIHALPTKNGLPVQSILPHVKNYEELNHIYQHIFITNDEDIKKGDWVYSIWDKKIKRAIKDIKDALFLKKIILTTDGDLIKDGVQAIDDEFLEWFVKNPSCEEVKIIDFHTYFNQDIGNKGFYKIIIPKEEPKQEKLHRLIKEKLDENKPKQETLEDFIKRESKSANESVGIVKGAKWQQEQDKKLYSEEEVIGMLKLFVTMLKKNHTHTYTIDFEKSVKKWFEKFKKK